jgi:hypothetical protein
MAGKTRSLSVCVPNVDRGAFVKPKKNEGF